MCLEAYNNYYGQYAYYAYQYVNQYDKANKAYYQCQAEGNENGHRENGAQVKQAYHVVARGAVRAGVHAGTTISRGVRAAVVKTGIEAVEKALKHCRRLLSDGLYAI